MSYKYVDLFSGCGGLSVGLERAGLELELAVEKSDMAAETFYHNFIQRISDQAQWKEFSSENNPVTEQAKSKLVVKELRKVLDCEELVAELKAKDIDLIAGGPPCQGFSMAGRRNPDDVRNQLPWQFLELVEKAQPKAVVIENVAGMRQNFVKHSKEAPFYQLRRALEETTPGYTVQPVLLNAMHYGVPEHRPRVMLIGIRKDIADKLGIFTTEETWKSEYDRPGGFTMERRPDLAPVATFFGDAIRNVKDAIWDLDETSYKMPRDSREYLGKGAEYANYIRNDISWMPEHLRSSANSDVIANQTRRKHSDNVRLRFRLYQYLRDSGISSKILNIPAKSDLPKESQIAEIREFLGNARFPAKSPDGEVIATSLNGLIDLIMSLGTKKHSQRPLKWDAPSPTVVSLPDDFVHPEQPRTLTVRELARFQSFPDNFEFRSKETTGAHRRRVEVPQYTQVGNAVPPLMAEAVGKVIKGILQKYDALVSSGDSSGDKALAAIDETRGGEPQTTGCEVRRRRAA